jgi:hypothetical protein
MSRQNINFGSNPNDGTGDTLRNAMTKINENFIDLYGETSVENNLVFGVNTIGSTNINGNINLETNGIGTVNVNQGILVNTGSEFSNSVFYAANGSDLLTVDVSNGRIGINRSNPSSTLDVAGSAAISGNLTVAASLTVGSNSGDRLTVNSAVHGNLIPATNFNLGSANNKWNQAHVVDARLDSITSTEISASTVAASSGFSGNITGQLTTSVDIRIQRGAFLNNVNTAVLTANRTTRFPNRNGTLAIVDNGRLSGPTGVAPALPIGVAGDRAGDIAADSDHIYYCTADFDGVTAIWRRTAISTW